MKLYADKKVKRSEVIRLLAQMTEEPPFFPESWAEELEFMSDILGGHSNFVDWKPNDIYVYLLGVLAGLELPYNWRLDWSDV